MTADRGEGWSRSEETEKPKNKTQIWRQEKRRQDEKEDKKEGNKKTEIRKIKIGFWNVAGLNNKDAQFWNYIKEFDIIGMVETWIDEKCWNRLKERMSENFN